MHLFIAIDAEGLDLSHIQDPAHLVIQDWGRSMQDSQNLCSFFIPSILDKSLCPEGKHVIHVYSSGGEPYEPWEELKPLVDPSLPLQWWSRGVAIRPLRMSVQAACARRWLWTARARRRMA